MEAGDDKLEAGMHVLRSQVGAAVGSGKCCH